MRNKRKLVMEEDRCFQCYEKSHRIDGCEAEEERCTVCNMGHGYEVGCAKPPSTQTYHSMTRSPTRNWEPTSPSKPFNASFNLLRGFDGEVQCLSATPYTRAMFENDDLPPTTADSAEIQCKPQIDRSYRDDMVRNENDSITQVNPIIRGKIRNDQVGAIMGLRGNRIAKVRNVSGVNITICRQRKFSAERDLIIEGPINRLEAAMNLLRLCVRECTRTKDSACNVSKLIEEVYDGNYVVEEVDGIHFF